MFGEFRFRGGSGKNGHEFRFLGNIELYERPLRQIQIDKKEDEVFKHIRVAIDFIWMLKCRGWHTPVSWYVFWNHLVVALFYTHPIECSILKSSPIIKVGDRIVPAGKIDWFVLNVPSDAAKFDLNETKNYSFDLISFYCLQLYLLKRHKQQTLYLSPELHARWNLMSPTHSCYRILIEIHLTVLLFYVRPIRAFPSATH